MRIVIVTTCTGEKAVGHGRALTLRDFRRGPQHVALRERELAGLLTPAATMYTGQQHVRLMRGVRAWAAGHEGNGARRRAPSLFIVSAGYGLIPGSRKVAPYECTFEGMKARELRDWADRLNVPADFRRVLAKPYDLGILLLGDAYLSACRLDAAVSFAGPTLFFCGGRAAERVPRLPNLRVVALSNADARRFSCPLVALKGELAARLLDRLARDADLAPRLQDPATDVLALLDEAARAGRSERSAFRANPAVDRVITIPPGWWDRPHRSRLCYLIPDWDDQVDPDYDFATDTHAGGSADWSNQVYAHQLYPEPNYDGIVISKVVAEASRRKKARVNELGVHRFLRVPPEFFVMGDCGAFGYIKQETPPYTTEEILDYYTRLGFNAGVSVDHLIVSATEGQRRQRYDLTVQNAEDFLRGHRRRRLRWEPIGAVQGWDADSYAEAARRTVAMGYRYIALGGLVRSSTPEILGIVRKVHEVVPASVKVHLFGLARLGALTAFADLGVRSVDSSSYLRQAWMRTKTSYVLDGDAYAALRIPEWATRLRAGDAPVSPERLAGLEREALRAVRAYAGRACSLDGCLNALLEYDRYVTGPRVDLGGLYRRTLAERPWERCGCRVCRTWGVEVIIFRGNNRNRRRGFHNTYVFYNLFQRILAGEPVVVQEHDVPGDEAPLFAGLADEHAGSNDQDDDRAADLPRPVLRGAGRRGGRPH
jgi:hypothetical protein